MNTLEDGSLLEFILGTVNSVMGFGVEQSNGNFYPLEQFTAFKTTDLLSWSFLFTCTT